VSGARTIFLNSAWMVGAEAATRITSLATILYLSRTLAPDGVGTVEFGLAVFGLLQLVTMNGVEARLVPAMVRAPGDATRLAGRSLLLAWGQMAVVFLLLLVIAWGVGLSPRMWEAAFVFGSAATFAPFAFRFAFLGGERMWPVGLGLIAGALAYLGLTVGVVHAPGHALRVGACWLVAMLVRAAIPFSIFVRREGRPVAELRGLGTDLVETAGLGIGGVARGVMVSIDVIVLGILARPEAVASYGLAAKLPLFLGTLIALFHTALFPTIVRAFTVGARDRVRRLTGTVLDVSLGIALPSVVCLGAISATVATVLFTSRFPDVGPLMALLLWRVPLSAMNGLCRMLVWARSPSRDARVAVEVLIVTVVVLVATTAWLGTWGTVVGMLCGDVVALVSYARHAGVDRIERLLAPGRPLAGAVFAGLALLAMPAGDPRARLAFVLVVWLLSVAVAAGPGLATLRRHLDEER